MNRTAIKSIGASLAVAAILGSSWTAKASEPINNYFTPSSYQLTGDMEVLVGTNSSFIFGITGGSISSSSDVDYVLVVCASPSNKYIDTIQLGGDIYSGGQPLPGDFDIYLYAPDSSSAFASGAQGSTTPEVVDISAYHKNTVVAKIVYYSGSTGNYGLRVNCYNG